VWVPVNAAFVTPRKFRKSQKSMFVLRLGEKRVAVKNDGKRETENCEMMFGHVFQFLFGPTHVALKLELDTRTLQGDTRQENFNVL